MTAYIPSQSILLPALRGPEGVSLGQAPVDPLSRQHVSILSFLFSTSRSAGSLQPRCTDSIQGKMFWMGIEEEITWAETLHSLSREVGRGTLEDG